MPSTRTQENRPVAISTALGKDVLLFRRATVIEQLARPFQIDVEVISETPDVQFSKVVGTNATVRLFLQGGKTRYFNGFVTRFAHTGGSTKTSHYRMTLSPWLWFLTRTADCRMFQAMKAPDIIKKVFREKGFSDFTDCLKGTYNEREYTVQYRETAFNFVSRIMEEEGIYYYWDHKDGKHLLVLADEYGSHDAYPEYKKVPYYPYSKVTRDQEYIWDWIVEQEIQPGRFDVSDYNFETPQQDMEGVGTRKREHAQTDFEIYDYPGLYKEHGQAEPRAKVRLDEYQAQHEIIRGRGDVRGLAVGCTFTLEGFPRDAQNKEYLVTSAVHELESDDYDSAGEGSSDAPCYRVSFSALLATQQYRPRRITPKPLICGPQTAFVTGPSGEEIYTDKYGRVKVQFLWDRDPDKRKDEELSCWMRVAQVWAGKSWGTVFLPRIGHEVVVEFLEGDPDRPLITGSVYNGSNMPPYALPENKTQSTIKSNSSKGGGGFNEIRFEDKKGEEQIYIQGEKDVHVRIKNDNFEWIGRDTHLIVKRDQIEHVERDRLQTIDGNHQEKIGGDRNRHVVGKEAVKIDGNHSETVTGDVAEVYEANHSETTTGNYYLKAKNICIEAETNVTIKVGSTHVAIESDSIKIGATSEIKVDSSGTITITGKGQVGLESSAAATEVSGLTTSVKGKTSVSVSAPSISIG